MGTKDKLRKKVLPSTVFSEAIGEDLWRIEVEVALEKLANVSLAHRIGTLNAGPIQSLPRS